MHYIICEDFAHPTAGTSNPTKHAILPVLFSIKPVLRHLFYRFKRVTHTEITQNGFHIHVRGIQYGTMASCWKHAESISKPVVHSCGSVLTFPRAISIIVL